MAKTEKKQEKEIGREYVIPLREKSRVVARYKKTPKAIKTIKEFVARHMKIENRDLNKVKINKNLNEFMWAKGIRKHPHKIKVKVIKEGENVLVDLVDYPNKLKFKKLREEKRGKDALESVDKKKSMMQKVKENMQNKETIEDKDKDKDGLDDKQEAIEKEKTSAEATQQFEKTKSKQAKHQTEKPAKAATPFRQALQK
jgi:large subunit ribosomal protein L31e